MSFQGSRSLAFINWILFLAVVCAVARAEYCADKYASTGSCPYSSYCCITQNGCSACQEIRGVWQGLLGTCVFEPFGQLRTTLAAMTLGMYTSGQCVSITSPDGTPAVDSSVIEFRNNSGRMVTTLGPGTATGAGVGTSSTIDQPSGPTDFNFDFTFSVRNQSSGDVDLFIDTFLGQRILYGKYTISVDQVLCALDSTTMCPRGTLLQLALGTSRPPSALPNQNAAVLEAESTYVYLHAYQTREYSPPLEVLNAQRFTPGSCTREVQEGETLASIALSYYLQWQDLYAYNADILDPSGIRPGDVIAVGRHHTVLGPCLANCQRQIDSAGNTAYDSSCMIAGQCLQCDWTNLPQLCGETLYGIATRYGTSWQRILDVNPQLAAVCVTAITAAAASSSSAAAAGGSAAGLGQCRLSAGDMVCVVPYLRNVVCTQEYRRYPVTDVLGNGWEDMGRYFTCNPVWSTGLLADKCCHQPRCSCCLDGGGAPSSTLCKSTLTPVSSCLATPSDPSCTPDCSCISGYVPLQTTDPASGQIYTTCLLATQCRRCLSATQRPPACTICAQSY